VGIIIVGFSTGTVIAQEVEIGDTSGSPFIKFDDATSPGQQYEIRLNDGTGKFQIFDITNARSNLVIKDNGNVGVGADDDPLQDFTIGCSSGACNIQTRAFDGKAQNTVRSLSGGDALFRLVDNEWDQTGNILFDITTETSGKIQFRDRTTPNSELVIFEITTFGADRGKVQFFGEVVDSSGVCQMNCP